MNRIKICKNAFAKIRKIALLFLFTLACNISNAQISVSSVADAAYDKKVQKSPAKDVILQSDRAINKVYDQHSSFNDAKKLIGYDEGRFVRSYDAYDSLEYYKKEILRLDPKWKVKRIETCQTTYATKHNEFSVFYLPYREGKKKHIEYNAYFSRVENLMKPLVGRGEEFYKFVSGQDTNKFNLSEYRKIEMEAVELLKTYEFYDKQLNRWYTPSITGMSYAMIRANDESYDYYTLLGRHFSNYKNLNDQSKPLQDYQFPEVLKELTRYENDYYIAKAIALLFPENARAKQIYNYEEINYKKFDEYKEKVAISKFHKENMGKVFFADHKVTFGQETAADFKTEFKAGEPIYVIIYEVEAFELKDDHTQYISVGVDDEWRQLDEYYVVSYADGVSSAGQGIVVQYCLTPTQDLKLPTDEYVQAHRPLEALANLKTGQHEIRVGSYSTKATFTLTVTESNNYTKSSEYAYNARKNSIPLPKAGMTDESVHGWVVKAFANSDSHDLDNVTFIRTIIISKEWDYSTNRYTNQITGRSCEIVMICKDKNGDCFVWHADYSQTKSGSVWNSPSVSFRQGLHVGEGTTHANYYRGDSDGRVYVNCSKF